MTTFLIVNLDNLVRLRANQDRSVALTVRFDDGSEGVILLESDTIRQVEGVLSEV